MTAKEISIPDQSEGTKDFDGRVTVSLVFEFRMKADTEDEAYEKAEKLARLKLLVFDNEPVDTRDIEVEFLSECVKKPEVKNP
jgi:hypothetical protein